jgi:hypothetical protein
MPRSIRQGSRYASCSRKATLSTDHAPVMIVQLGPCRDFIADRGDDALARIDLVARRGDDLTSRSILTAPILTTRSNARSTAPSTDNTTKLPADPS